MALRVDVDGRDAAALDRQESICAHDSVGASVLLFPPLLLDTRYR